MMVAVGESKAQSIVEMKIQIVWSCNESSEELLLGCSPAPTHKCNILAISKKTTINPTTMGKVKSFQIFPIDKAGNVLRHHSSVEFIIYSLQNILKIRSCKWRSKFNLREAFPGQNRWDFGRVSDPCLLQHGSRELKATIFLCWSGTTSIDWYYQKLYKAKAFLFKFKLSRTFYSNNLHNIVGSVLSVTLMVLFGGI